MESVLEGGVASDGVVEIRGWGISRLRGSQNRLRREVRAKVMLRLLGRPWSQQLEDLVEILDQGILAGSLDMHGTWRSR